MTAVWRCLESAIERRMAEVLEANRAGTRRSQLPAAPVCAVEHGSRIVQLEALGHGYTVPSGGADCLSLCPSLSVQLSVCM